MHAAVVKLYALADAVRPATQHHDFLALGRRGLALLVVGGVHVGRVGGKLARTGIDPLVHRAQAPCLTSLAYRHFAGFEQCGQAAVAKALLLELVEQWFVNTIQRLRFQPQLGLDQFLDLAQKPRVDVGQSLHFC